MIHCIHQRLCSLHAERKTKIRRRVLIQNALCICILASTSLPGNAQDDGLFAVFETTLGSFTARLDYVEAPMTVANFVGLAKGSRAWIDLTTGEVRNDPYYDGIFFHRVVSGFVIQGGSPAGNGSDGPGYSFRDEFSATLRHSSTGILSMANSGPHSNGSQFFITLAPTPHLDDLHSVFGEVVSGLDVVLAIGSLATDSTSKPLTNVVINSVTIVTNGTDASAFDIHAQGLPDVLPVQSELSRSGSTIMITVSQQFEHAYSLYQSTDLVTWTHETIALHVSPPPPEDIDISSSLNNAFFSVTDVFYPGPLYVPSSLETNITFNINGVGLISITLGSNGSGNWSSDFTGIPSGNLSCDAFCCTNWDQAAYNGTLFVCYDTLVPMQFQLDFQTPTNGLMRGTVFTGPSTPISGNFTIP